MRVSHLGHLFRLLSGHTQTEQPIHIAEEVMAPQECTLAFPSMSFCLRNVLLVWSPTAHKWFRIPCLWASQIQGRYLFLLIGLEVTRSTITARIIMVATSCMLRKDSLDGTMIPARQLCAPKV